MPVGSMLWSSRGGDPCPHKVACFRNMTMLSTEYCVETFWTLYYPDALRKAIKKENDYLVMPHKEAEKCGWTVVRSNPAASIYYRNDNNATAMVSYEETRRGANGAIWMLHHTAPWGDLLMAVGIPFAVIILVVIVIFRGRNKTVRAREEKAKKNVWESLEANRNAVVSDEVKSKAGGSPRDSILDKPAPAHVI